SSSMPWRRSCRSTILARRPAKSVMALMRSRRRQTRDLGPSEDVVVELGRVEDSHPAAAGADDAGALEVGEEAADALARGAGELGQVGLVHPDRHLSLLAAAGFRRK